MNTSAKGTNPKHNQKTQTNKVYNMTKVEALKQYKVNSKDFIKSCKKSNDYIMLREAWHIYVDGLNRQGFITDKQADNWSNPF